MPLYGRQIGICVALVLAALTRPALGIDCDSSTLQGSGSACYLNLSTDRYYRCEDGLNCQSYARCKYADGSRKSCGICRTAKSSNDDITCDLPMPPPPPPPPPPPVSTAPPGDTDECMSTGTFSSQCDTPAVLEVMRLNNALRASEGKNPLICDDNLSAEAQRYSIDLCRQPTSGTSTTGGLTHTLCGESIGPRCDAVDGGWTRCGENIAYNFQYDLASGTAVYDQWENSPGHRANMVNADFDAVGYGYHRCTEDHLRNGVDESADRTYWTGLYVQKR